MLTTGAITFIVAVWYFLYFPDSPMNARFLTHDEKIMFVLRPSISLLDEVSLTFLSVLRTSAIERIRSNKTGIENKFWKKEQFIEALTDCECLVFLLNEGLYAVLRMEEITGEG